MSLSRLEINPTDYCAVISGSTSKGNQTKYTNGEIWVKLDYLGYEDLAEYYASKVLECSNITNYVDYQLCTFNGYNGCYSYNFLKTGETLVTLGRLLQSVGITSKTIDDIKNTELRLKLILDNVKDCTGLDIYTYLSNMLAFDAIIMNEDRHIINIALIYNEDTDKYSEAPIFDNGLSLLSDTFNYREDISPTILARKIKSRPLNTSFKRQLEVLQPTLQIDVNKYTSLLCTIINPRIKYILSQATLQYPQLFTYSNININKF